MSDPPVSDEPRKVGWPVLVVLLFFFAGTAYLVTRVHEDTAAIDETPAPIDLDAAGLADGGAGWVHHAWTNDASTNTPRADYDPQREAMEEHFADDAGVDAPFDPIELPLRVLRRRGEVPIGADLEPCALRVLPAHLPPFNCAIRVTCAGQPVYPDPLQTAGFNECGLDAREPTSALDEDPSGVDQDPRLDMNLRRGRVRVGDEHDGESWHVDYAVTDASR